MVSKAAQECRVGKAVKEIREAKFLVKGMIEYLAEYKAEGFIP